MAVATTRPLNWSGTHEFSGPIDAPTSVDELQELVARSPRVHAVGTRHSFSDVADAPARLVSVTGLPTYVEVDSNAATARISAGSNWAEVVEALHRSGFAMHNLGSLPHISVAGTLATGTHGSGHTLRCLGAATRGLTMVGAGGEVVTVDARHPQFPGMVVSLGALGVVTEVVVGLVPTYDITQTVYDGLSRAALLEHHREILDSAYNVSIFTTWAPGEPAQIWVKQRADDVTPDTAAWIGVRPADGPRHPVPGMDPLTCTPQQGTSGPWFTRLPHFRAEFIPSAGEEIQTEYFVPRKYAAAALAAIDELGADIAPVCHISELRTIAADDLWLSPNQGRASLAIHFTWIRDLPAVLPVLLRVEEVLAPFDPRPHWGKVFRLPVSAIERTYPRWSDARDLIASRDPGGVFASPFTDRLGLTSGR